jgi:hypothetical protein
MRGTVRLRPCFVLGAVAALVAGCTSTAPPTHEPGTESMPGYASVWLTSDPAVPDVPVLVTMMSPDDPGILFQHTFVAGVPLRGSFATSEGRYHLAARGRACSADLVLGPSELAMVTLTLEGDSGCSMALTAVHNMDTEEIELEEPAVLITNHGVGNETPRIEPPPSLP